MEKLTAEDIANDPTRYWYYYPEADSYFTATRAEFYRMSDAVLMSELGVSTIDDEAEGRALLTKLVADEQRIAKPTPLPHFPTVGDEGQD